MDYIVILVIAAIVFGICFLADKGFVKVFRSRSQHISGRSVRLSKRYGSIGTILAVLGVASVLSGLKSDWLLIAGGILIAVVGMGLVVYYLSFGVYYDEETFLVSGFGRKSREYRFSDIRSQQLYTSLGNMVIELHLEDGRTVQLQLMMEGVYPFLDHAFCAWCRQKGISPESCEFHDSQNSRWFPNAEEA